MVVNFLEFYVVLLISSYYVARMSHAGLTRAFLCCAHIQCHMETVVYVLRITCKYVYSYKNAVQLFERLVATNGISDSFES